MAHLLELAHLYLYWILNKLSYKAHKQAKFMLTSLFGCTYMYHITKNMIVILHHKQGICGKNDN